MNANDQLREHTCTDNYYRHQFGMLYTDGILALCEKFECYWLLDLVCSYQKGLRNEEFQVWTLKKNEDETATVTCTDGNDGILRTQKIAWTDFKADVATVWVEGEVVLLPSEH